MKGRTVILVLLGILIVLGAVIGIIVVQLFYRQPFIPPSTLAAMMSLTPQGSVTPGTGTPMRILTATTETTPTPTFPPYSTPEVLFTPVITDTPGPLKEVCGTTGSYILLTVLTDITSQDTLFNGAIGFRIVNVDFSHERIVVYALPPELVFPDSNLLSYGLMYPSLSGAFNSIYNVERSNADAISLASNGTARLINENLGILASHYMIVDTANIEKFANSLGSVDVKLSAPFLSDEYDMARGSQKLDGSMIRKFITYKGGGGAGEWDRVLRQNDVINAFRGIAKKYEPAAFVKMFINQTEDGFASDLSIEQLNQLVCLANSIEPVRFRYFTIPISRLNINDDGTITIKDQDSLRANIANSLGGTGE
ncbi:MAG: hypothetical protein GYA12_08700 [Chloroflexi bacterium]|nr:hypothetical protein [Chloroflexota bacterium]BCY18471.1 hypothetical protein hrd7_23200 [Leptolinea sp. HRD-7]